MPTRLGENLLRLMALKGWQQNDLAKEAGLSEACVSRLLTGTNRNPSTRSLQGLAHAFGVSTSQLLEERPSEDLELELQLIRALRDSPVRGITLRARDLSREGLGFVVRVIDQVRAYEGLKKIEDDTSLQEETGGTPGSGLTNAGGNNKVDERRPMAEGELSPGERAEEAR